MWGVNSLCEVKILAGDTVPDRQFPVPNLLQLNRGFVAPGLPGTSSQGETLDELHENLREVIEMLLEDEEVVFKTEFVGTQQIVVQ